MARPIAPKVQEIIDKILELRIEDGRDLVDSEDLGVIRQAVDVVQVEIEFEKRRVLINRGP